MARIVALMAVAVLAATPAAELAAPAAPKVGLQLYSLRDYIGKDVKGVLAKVAKAGYQAVETYGYSRDTHFWGLTAPEFVDLRRIEVQKEIVQHSPSALTVIMGLERFGINLPPIGADK